MTVKFEHHINLLSLKFNYWSCISFKIISTVVLTPEHLELEFGFLLEEIA